MRMGPQARVALMGVVALGVLGVYLAQREAPQLPEHRNQPPLSHQTDRGVPTSDPATSAADTPTAVASVTQVPPQPEPPDGQLPPYHGPERNAQRAALIRDALIARKAVQAGATMPESVGTGNQVDKPLGEYVARTMREQFIPLATECYEALLGTDPRASGNVELEFSVLGDPAVGGVVVDVALGKGTTLRNDAFRTCMTESMYAVVFDAPPGKDGSVTVKQSFELWPD